VCKKHITGKYKEALGKLFCSDQCFITILPKCSICQLGSVKILKQENKNYCPTCIKRPKCFACGHPFGQGVQKNDGRFFCNTCRPLTIFDNSKAQKLYVNAQKSLLGLIGKKANTVPPLKFVNLVEMKKQHPVSNAAGMSLRGFYSLVNKKTDIMEGNKLLETKVEKVSETIFVVDGLKKEDFMITAVHELTHDWLEEFYPGIKVAPLWVEEGCCQYLAYMYCMKNNYKKQALRIQKSPDKIYGDGFRFYLKKFGNNSWPKVEKWLRQQGYHVKPAPGAVRR